MVRRLVAQADAFDESASSVDVKFARSRQFPELVRVYWEVHGTFPSIRERVLPTGDIFVLVNVGAPQLMISSERGDLFSDTCICGIQRGPLVTGVLGATDLWGAKLSPRAAQLAFGSAAAVAGAVADFADVMGAKGNSLAGYLRDAPTFEARCAIFDAHIADAVRSENLKWRSEVEWALDRIFKGGAEVGALARAIGWSRKHLHESVVGHLGQAPKTLIRIARFERALRIIGDRSDIGLAEVALEAGYCDQPHLTREFRALSGLTPAAYLRSRVIGADYGFVDADG